MFCVSFHLALSFLECRVTTCLENLEMSGNLLTGNCQGINLVMEKGTKNWLLLVAYLHSYRYLVAFRRKTAHS